MNLDDTIVAIATPLGRGGIGVVRLAGPLSIAIAVAMLRLSNDLQHAKAVYCDLIEPVEPESGQESKPDGAYVAPLQAEGIGEFKASSNRIDEVVVTYFAKPHSYTTDDIVEISAHGSPVVLRHIVELSQARGARLAEPGEFTMRAFLNGRLDLTQAEAVRDLIDSQTLFQAKVAAQQLQGSLSTHLKPIKKKLIDLIAILEAGIDFAEDDISVAPDATILQRIHEVKAPLALLAESFKFGKVIHQGLTLAIIGRPNVGKSSLFNRLVERERAIVTAQPGTTRDLVSETVAIGGIPVELVDTAGIRKAFDEAESIGIRKSMEALADADLVLIVRDRSDPHNVEDNELIRQVEGRPALVVDNKADLGKHFDRDFPDHGLNAEVKPAHSAPSVYANSEISPLKPIPTSALTGEGIPALREAILKQIAGEKSTQMESGILTSVRHKKLVEDSINALETAERAVAARVPHEMLLLDLYAALRALDEITGATTTDDILNLIFGTFCIGK